MSNEFVNADFASQSTPKEPGSIDSRAPVEDRTLKTAAQFFGEELLPILGIEGKVVGVAPTEQVYLQMKDFHEVFI